MRAISLTLFLAGGIALSACSTERDPAPEASAAAGRSYSRKDLQKTGRPTTAGALEASDPSVRLFGDR